MPTPIISITDKLGEKKRRPRFEREPYSALMLRAQHMALLSALARYRMLQTAHFVYLTGLHPSTVKGHLTALYHNGFVHRPKAQLFGWTTGSNGLTYTLTDKGARAIGHAEPAPARDLSYPAIEHRLAISAFHIVLDKTMFAHADAHLEPVMGHDTTFWEWRGGTTDKRPTVTYTHNGVDVSKAILPDGFFSVCLFEQEFPLFLEMDLGTEPVHRSNPHQTSIAQKFLKYSRLFDEHRTHKERSVLSSYFGVSQFRVLFITTSEEREHRMHSVLHTLMEKSRGLFWFTTQQRIAEARSLCAPIWTHGKWTSGSPLATLLP